MKEFKLSDVQAEAILNMKLRSLRKLEEMQIKTEYENLDSERKSLEELLADENLRWKKISEQVADIKKRFGQKTTQTHKIHKMNFHINIYSFTQILIDLVIYILFIVIRQNIFLPLFQGATQLSEKLISIVQLLMQITN